MISATRAEKISARVECAAIILRLLHNVLNLRAESTDLSAVMFLAAAQKKIINRSLMNGAFTGFAST
jgi:hypothetical protein